MIKRILSFACLIVVFSLESIGQTNSDPGTQILKVIPASPTAAGLGLYGNTPISYYTGTPNVSIPLFDISSGSLKLPVTLSHHGGGIKVEEMASWVGLGWSLNAGGCITRTVRGIPDNTGSIGAFNTPMSIKFLNDNMDNPAYQAEILQHLKDAGKGEYDLECDLFQFNFGGYTGQFVYDQDAHEFYTIPRMNLKITYNSTTEEFLVVTPSGERYLFGSNEHTTISSTNCSPAAPAQSPPVYNTSISSWFLTKIQDVSLTSEINFAYTDKLATFQNSTSSTSYILTGTYGSSAPLIMPPAMDAQHCYQITTIDEKKLQFIYFKNGYLKLNSATARCDLSGDDALDNIELYSLDNVLKKRFSFEHGYFGDLDQPVNCSDQIASASKKLKLKSVTEENTVNGTLSQKKPYKFNYNEEYNFSRLSFAQDHWGYYNNAINNTSLIPATFHFSAAGPVWWPGADRTVNPLANQVGSLTKIIYPTGGSTEFTYESNMVKDNTLDPVTVLNQYSIEGDHNGGVQTVYESQPFVINEASSPLNGNNANGGAFVTVKFDGIGNCGYNIPGQHPLPTTCAVLTVEAVGSGVVLGPMAEDMINRYLPNGTYKLKASFNQNPAGYEDFYMSLTWKTIHPDFVDKQYAGGIRIKKITDYDGIDHAKDVVRNFSYNDASNISTGKINGRAANYIGDYTQRFYSSFTEGLCNYFMMERTFIKRQSYSNYPLLTSAGSYVGYGNVSITYGNNNNDQHGRTEYLFKNEPTDAILPFPFPSKSFDWQRGQILQEKQNRFASNTLQVISKTNNVYENELSPVFKSVLGIKTGFDRGCIIVGPCSTSHHEAHQTQEAYTVPTFTAYGTYVDYMRNTSTTTIQYDQADNTKSITTSKIMEYDDLVFQPAAAKSSNSSGDEVTLKTLYAKDYDVNAPYGYFIRTLLEKGMVTVPIEQYSIVKKPNGDQFITGGTLVLYKNAQPVQDKILKLDLPEPLPLNQFTVSHYSNGGTFIYDSHYKEEVSFNQFDGSYNITERQKKNDVLNSYVWDYNSSLPVAECINANAANIAATSFESDGKGNFSFSGSPVNDATAPTGNKCYYLGTYGISKSGLPSNTYIVSYWGKGGACSVNSGLPVRTGKTIGLWTYYEHEFTGTSASIYGNGYIDELRLYPKGAQMKTYTYDPLIGITSQCDAANNILYYEYDALGRLLLVRNEDRNILKQYDYKYQSAVPNTTPLWETTGMTRCKPCPQNSNYITNTMQQQEKDNNPESGSYGQLRWTDAGLSLGCMVLEDWQNTATPDRCRLDANNHNTGEVEQEQMNMNPCHPTYGQTRWIVKTTDYVRCPVPVTCNSSNCSGPDKKCVNGVCETGTKVYLTSTWVRLAKMWLCEYHYVFSDSSTSATYSEYSMTSCL